jgi:hypothetical protein
VPSSAMKSSRPGITPLALCLRINEAPFGMPISNLFSRAA